MIFQHHTLFKNSCWTLHSYLNLTWRTKLICSLCLEYLTCIELSHFFLNHRHHYLNLKNLVRHVNSSKLSQQSKRLLEKEVSWKLLKDQHLGQYFLMFNNLKWTWIAHLRHFIATHKSNELFVSISVVLFCEGFLLEHHSTNVEGWIELVYKPNKLFQVHFCLNAFRLWKNIFMNYLASTRRHMMFN